MGRSGLFWTLFLSLLGFMMLCLNTLLRRQWTESEKLSYPLVMLPLEMVNPRTQLFKSRLFWTGAAVAAVLEIWERYLPTCTRPFPACRS